MSKDLRNPLLGSGDSSLQEFESRDCVKIDVLDIEDDSDGAGAKSTLELMPQDETKEGEEKGPRANAILVQQSEEAAASASYRHGSYEGFLEKKHVALQRPLDQKRKIDQDANDEQKRKTEENKHWGSWFKNKWSEYGLFYVGGAAALGAGGVFITYLVKASTYVSHLDPVSGMSAGEAVAYLQKKLQDENEYTHQDLVLAIITAAVGSMALGALFMHIYHKYWYEIPTDREVKALKALMRQIEVQMDDLRHVENNVPICNGNPQAQASLLKEGKSQEEERSGISIGGTPVADQAAAAARLRSSKRPEESSDDSSSLSSTSSSIAGSMSSYSSSSSNSRFVFGSRSSSTSSSSVNSNSNSSSSSSSSSFDFS